MRRGPSGADVLVGQRIRQIRHQRGITLTKIAERLGLSYQQLQKYESGANRVAALRLVEIANLLEVPVGSLFAAAMTTEPPSALHDSSSNCLAAAHSLSEATAALLSAARGKRAVRPEDVLPAIVDAALRVAEIEPRPEDTDLMVALYRWANRDRQQNDAH